MQRQRTIIINCKIINNVVFFCEQQRKMQVGTSQYLGHTFWHAGGEMTIITCGQIAIMSNGHRYIICRGSKTSTTTVRIKKFEKRWFWRNFESRLAGNSIRCWWDGERRKARIAADTQSGGIGKDCQVCRDEWKTARTSCTRLRFKWRDVEMALIRLLESIIFYRYTSRK